MRIWLTWRTIAFLLLTFFAVAAAPEIKLIRRVVPPKENPYPAKTAMDTKREIFAREAISLFWSREYSVVEMNRILFEKSKSGKLDSRTALENRSWASKPLACLKAEACWRADVNFLQQVSGIQGNRNAFRNPQILWAHAVPWTLNLFGKNLATRPDAYQRVEMQKKTYAHTDDPQAFVVYTPEFKADEYLIDAVVQFEHQKNWWHIRLVVNENSQKEIMLRYFLIDSIQDLTQPTLYH